MDLTYTCDGPGVYLVGWCWRRREVERDGHRAGDVGGGVLFGGPHVDDDHVAGFGPPQQLGAADRLIEVVTVQVGGTGGLGVGQVGVRQLTQRPVQGRHVAAGDPVVDAGAVAAGGD